MSSMESTQSKKSQTAAAFTVAAMYQFADLGEGCGAHVTLREPLREFMAARDINGTILLAHEGINGTVAGSADAIAELVEFLRTDSIFKGKLNHLELKFAEADKQPFLRSKVRLKKEIVTMGAYPFAHDDTEETGDTVSQVLRTIDSTEIVGTYVDAEQWNALIDDPEVTLIDTRNDYEVAVGTFAKADGQAAVDPKTESFREFPNFVEQQLDPAKHKKVAMYCTGGIRCEKATAYLMQRGFEAVYHLKGGILRYLETVEPEESRWQGECYVFDRRVTVGHDLQPGSYVLCFACGRPVKNEDTSHQHYVKGVSCPQCIDEYTDEQRAGFAERQRQLELAKARGENLS